MCCENDESNFHDEMKWKQLLFSEIKLFCDAKKYIKLLFSLIMCYLLFRSKTDKRMALVYCRLWWIKEDFFSKTTYCKNVL